MNGTQMTWIFMTYMLRWDWLHDNTVISSTGALSNGQKSFHLLDLSVLKSFMFWLQIMAGLSVLPLLGDLIEQGKMVSHPQITLFHQPSEM
jgi:hypothetical protein